MLNFSEVYTSALLQILHHVDGTSHVVKIAAEADVDINLVKACLQNLL